MQISGGLLFRLFLVFFKQTITFLRQNDKLMWKMSIKWNTQWVTSLLGNLTKAPTNPKYSSLKMLWHFGRLSTVPSHYRHVKVKGSNLASCLHPNTKSLQQTSEAGSNRHFKNNFVNFQRYFVTIWKPLIGHGSL